MVCDLQIKSCREPWLEALEAESVRPVAQNFPKAKVGARAAEAAEAAVGEGSGAAGGVLPGSFCFWVSGTSSKHCGSP